MGAAVHCRSSLICLITSIPPAQPEGLTFSLYCKIDAEYIIKNLHSGEVFFVFIDKGTGQRYYCKSAFERTTIDYLENQAVLTVLKKEKVSVIALGPMTNLAKLIQKDPEAFDQIEELVSMGGSFKSHGNCSPVAEYNYWCDPDAAALVYDTLHQNGKMIHPTLLRQRRPLPQPQTRIRHPKIQRPRTGSPPHD